MDSLEEFRNFKHLYFRELHQSIDTFRDIATYKEPLPDEVRDWAVIALENTSYTAGVLSHLNNKCGGDGLNET